MTRRDVEDEIDATAFGGLYENLPQGHYKSYRFVGSFLGVALMDWSFYGSFVLPSSSILLINSSIGPSNYYTLTLTLPLLIAGSLLTIVGRLGDVFGRRYFLIFGQIAGVIGALISARSKNIPTLLGGSVFLGIAQGVWMTFPYVILELVPNSRRALADAVLFLAATPFAGFGPIIGRALATKTVLGWRWFYYITIMTSFLSLVLFWFCYFPPSYKQLHTVTSKKEQLMKIDFVGITRFAGGFIVLNLSLSWFGAPYPWNSAHVQRCFSVGLIALFAFVIWEVFALTWLLKTPLIPMKLLKTRSYVVLIVIASISTMLFLPLQVLWPQMVNNLYTSNDIQIGWKSVFKVVGHARWQLVAGAVLMTCFVGGLSASNQFNEKLSLALTFLTGVSVGYLELVTIIMATLICEPADIGLASGFLASIRVIVGTIATTIYVSIYVNRISKTLPLNVDPAAITGGLPLASLPSLFAQLSMAASGKTPNFSKSLGINSMILSSVFNAVKTANAEAYQTVFLTAVAFGVLSIVAAFFSKKMMTDEVVRRLRKAREASLAMVSKSADVELNTILPEDPMYRGTVSKAVF